MKNNDISQSVLCAQYESVFRYVYSLCRDKNIAEDITQETFLKAFNASDDFKANSSLYTWLCAIAKNIWFNKCKNDSREVQIDYDFTIKDDLSFKEKLGNKDTALEIHKVLHVLKDPYKEVFTLRVFGELSFIEIATLFCKTESWARVTYHRSKKIIIEKLREGESYE